MNAISELAGEVGIVPVFVDMAGAERVTPRQTQIALLAAMGFDAGCDRKAGEALAAIRAEKARRALPQWLVIRSDTVPQIPLAPDAKWRLTLEDGSQADGRGSRELPQLPVGRHVFELEGDTTLLLSAPERLPEPPRAWGVTLPLSGLRDAASGGLGDYRDLAEAGAALGARNAAFVGINPVHAGFPHDTSACSPYSPSHRRRMNVLHIATGDRPNPSGDLIDFHRLVPEKLASLHRAFSDFANSRETPLFGEFLEREGAPLAEFALHQSLSKIYGPYWSDWPTAFHDPAGPASSSARRDLAWEIRFHSWLQFMAERQLLEAGQRVAAAGMELGLYLDLAVGTHPFGAETWHDRSQFANGASLGAPPDSFAPDGQNWGLSPFNPVTLAAENFRALADTLRKQLQFARMLRVDHILGFERAFWVPRETGLPGAYVSMPREAMLAVTRIEAARANATIIGEDLGNIPNGLQQSLQDSGILGCRLVVFEHRVRNGGGYIPGADYPPGTLASFSTHDLPTWIGWRKGADIAIRHEIGRIDMAAHEWLGKERAAEVAAFDTAAEGDISVDAMHGFLAGTASRLAAVQIEDILGVEQQPNLPGTIDEYPNWRRRLPVGANGLAGEPRLARTADIMTRSGR